MPYLSDHERGLDASHNLYRAAGRDLVDRMLEVTASVIGEVNDAYGGGLSMHHVETDPYDTYHTFALTAYYGIRGKFYVRSQIGTLSVSEVIGHSNYWTVALTIKGQYMSGIASRELMRWRGRKGYDDEQLLDEIRKGFATAARDGSLKWLPRRHIVRRPQAENADGARTNSNVIVGKWPGSGVG